MTNSAVDATITAPAFWLAALIVFGAIFVRGVTGFGAALVLVPLLSLFWNLRQVVMIAALVQVVTGVPLTLEARREVAWRVLATLLAGSLCGLPLGAALLTILPLPLLRRGLGLLTLVFGLTRLLSRGDREPARMGDRLTLLGVPCGFVGGFLTGVIGTGGPPVVAYLYYRLPLAAARRATLLAYFMTLDALRLPGYLRLGVAGTATLWTALALVPFAVLGGIAGSRVHGRAGERTVATAMALLLTVTGVVLLR